MHYSSEKNSLTRRVPWPKICGISIGCLGLWFNLGCRGLAQSNNQFVQQPIVPSSTTLEGTVNQILLPPNTDVPEEILRTEIIFDARSPIDGTALSAADYAHLQTELAAPQTPRTLSVQLRYTIFLLQARRALKPVIPLLP